MGEAVSTALLVINKPRKETWCRYCKKWIDNRGYGSHVHFRHLREYLADFRFTLVRNMGQGFVEELHKS